LVKPKDAVLLTVPETPPNEERVLLAAGGLSEREVVARARSGPGLTATDCTVTPVVESWLRRAWMV
jgi:hypothetical protein